MARATGTPSRDRAEWAALALLLVVGLALRLLRIDVREPWLDEACTSLFAQSRDFGALLDTLRPESHPPLYYALLYGWVGGFGASEVALRAPSVIAGLALVPLVFRVARRHGAGTLAAALGGLVAAASPLLVYYSVEAKSYALLWSLAIGVVLLLHRATDSGDMRRSRPTRAFTGAAVLLAAALYTHHFALFLLPLWPLAVLAAPRRARAHGAMAGLVVLLAWAPWAVGFLGEQAASGGTAWLSAYQTGPLDALVGSARVLSLAPPFPEYLGELGLVVVPPGVTLAVGLWFGVPVALGLFAAARAPGAPLGAPLRAFARRALLPLALLLPPVGAAVVSIWRPLYLVGRYELIAYPAWIALWALGIDFLVRRPARRGPLAALRVGAVCLSVTGLALVAGPYLAQPASPWYHRDAARAFAAEGAAGDAVVIVGLARAPLEHQLRRVAAAVAVESFPPDLAEHPGWFAPDRYSPADLATAAREQVAGLRERPGVWLVTPLDAEGRLRDAPVALAIFGALRESGRTPGAPRTFGRLGVARFQ